MLERLSGPPIWAGWAAALLPPIAWLLAASGRSLPSPLNRAIVIAALAVLAWGCVAWGLSAWRGTRDGPAAGGRALVTLLAISFLVRFIGLDFELIDHWYSDEGVFRAQGRAINGGSLLPANFNYGHLSFYLSAFTLWIEGLFPRTASALVNLVYDAPRPVAVSMALLRAQSALLGALTTVPVFVTARRAAGLGAAVCAGALIAFSPLYNQVAHLAISDVPAAFFAALAVMFVARLLDGESLRDYLLAGIAAALAAASKYPGGVSAVAIVAVWLGWRWRRRDVNLLLLWSGLASMATFLAVMPALWLNPAQALRGRGLDLLFGWRQYSTGQWLGLSPDSPLLWYAGQLVSNHGAVALILGLTGAAFVLPRAARLRVAVLAAFPLVYLALIGSMSLVVQRNLQPLIPALAAVLGAGVAGWGALLAGRSGDRSGRLYALVVAAALLEPAARTLGWTYSQTRPGTNELVATWVESNVPEGAGIVKESNTPRLDARKHEIRQVPLAVNLEPRELESGRWEYLILSSRAWGPFFDPEAWFRPQHKLVYERYRELQETLPQVVEVAPSWARSGPLLTVYRVDAAEPRYRTRRRFLPRDASHANDQHLLGDEGPIRFSRRGQAATFKDYFEPGSYRLRLKTRPRSIRAWVHAASVDNRFAVTVEPAGGAARLELPARDKYLLRVFLAGGGSLQHMSLERLEPD